MFLFYYNQAGGGRMNQQLPINILRSSPIKYFSINFHQHKNFYIFFQENVVDDFLKVVYSRFTPGDENKIQGYAEIINQQQGELVSSEDTRVCMTNVYTAKYFNDYVRGAIKHNIMKRIIKNGETGSSWVFKRFNRLQIIIMSTKEFKTVMSTWLFFSVDR